MPLAPQAKAAIERNAAASAGQDASPAGRRAAQKAQRLPSGPPVGRTEDRVIAGSGGRVPIRIYAPGGDGPFPALVWMHGGGWVVGGLETSDSVCRHISVGAACIVVSVDYRLAPENKFPAALEDSYAAAVWAMRNGAFWKIDPDRVAIGGDSAGGNLAAALALMARDKGGPKLAHQVLVYPVTDRDFTTRSYQDNGVGYGLGREGMQ